MGDIMKKLVQYIDWKLSKVISNKMYCYGEANFEANQAMQEPLEKLYNYENQPDMREKIKEYISELDAEIDRCTKFIEDKLSKIKDNGKKEIYLFSIEYITLKTRVKTLTEVKNDLQGRLEELI